MWIDCKYVPIIQKYNYASPSGLYLNYSPYNPGLHPGLNYAGLIGLKHLHAEDIVAGIENFLFLLRNTPIENRRERMPRKSFHLVFLRL